MNRGRGTGDGGQGTGEDRLDPVLDEVLEALVTPATRVDLRASVLRRIEEERESRAGGWWSFNWRLAPLAAAAAILIVTAIVLWRGSGPGPSEIVVDSMPQAPSARPPAAKSIGPQEPIAPVRVDRPVRSRTPVTDVAAREVTEPLPALEAPLPISVNEVTTAALQVDPLAVAPLEIPTVDIDRPWR